MAKDPFTAIFVVVMPLAMAALMKGLFRDALAGQEMTDATGGEFAVPGMAVAFAAFSVGYSGFAFFRDQSWSTWERLRASPATSCWSPAAACCAVGEPQGRGAVRTVGPEAVLPVADHGYMRRRRGDGWVCTGGSEVPLAGGGRTSWRHLFDRSVGESGLRTVDAVRCVVV